LEIPERDGPCSMLKLTQMVTGTYERVRPWLDRWAVLHFPHRTQFHFIRPHRRARQSCRVACLLIGMFFWVRHNNHSMHDFTRDIEK
jgi:hypothetical protein